MRTLEDLQEVDQDSFFTLEDILLEGLASFQEAASTIQLNGIQAFDSCGRYVVLAPEGETNFLGISIEGALKRVQGLMSDECARVMNNEELEDQGNNECWRLQAEMPLVQVYGWKVRDLPDFKQLHEQWCDQVPGSNHRDAPTTKLRPQAENSVRKLLRGLITVCYGEKDAGTLDKKQSPLISQIQSDLDLKDFKFDEKTLRKWLKNPPP